MATTAGNTADRATRRIAPDSLPPLAALLSEADRALWSELRLRKARFEHEWQNAFAVIDPEDAAAREELEEEHEQAAASLHEQLDALMEELKIRVARAWRERPQSKAILALLERLPSEDLLPAKLTASLTRELTLPEEDIEFELLMLDFLDATSDVPADRSQRSQSTILKEWAGFAAS